MLRRHALGDASAGRREAGAEHRRQIGEIVAM